MRCCGWMWSRSEKFFITAKPHKKWKLYPYMEWIWIRKLCNAMVFMISPRSSSGKKSYAIKLFIRNSPYIHKKAKIWDEKTFSLPPLGVAPIWEKHVQHARPIIKYWSVFVSSPGLCGYVIHEVSRKLNNKIITNSVLVRIEKWFGQARRKRSEMENLTFVFLPSDNNIIKCVI